MGVYYLSVAAAGFLMFIIALAIIRLIVFCLLWMLTVGQHHLWLFPNLTEDVGFFASFWPLYQYEYKGGEKKPSKKKKKDKDSDNEEEDKTEKEDEEDDDAEEGEDMEEDRSQGEDENSAESKLDDESFVDVRNVFTCLATRRNTLTICVGTVAGVQGLTETETRRQSRKAAASSLRLAKTLRWWTKTRSRILNTESLPAV
ncbi:Translocation protein S62 [Homalodisca vitripennis]|nr:Translocation protein S62 [Homalodisca vitripennis]